MHTRYEGKRTKTTESTDRRRDVAKITLSQFHPEMGRELSGSFWSDGKWQRFRSAAISNRVGVSARSRKEDPRQVFLSTQTVSDPVLYVGYFVVSIMMTIIITTRSCCFRQLPMYRTGSDDGG